jgi:hypothetical protein
MLDICRALRFGTKILFFGMLQTMPVIAQDEETAQDHPCFCFIDYIGSDPICAQKCEQKEPQGTGPTSGNPVSPAITPPPAKWGEPGNVPNVGSDPQPVWIVPKEVLIPGIEPNIF